MCESVDALCCFLKLSIRRTFVFRFLEIFDLSRGCAADEHVREYQYKDPGSLCQHVFLMADKASVDSVLHRTDEQQPYIIAVDDGNHTYEMSDDEDDSDSNSNTNPDSNSNPNSDNDNENTKIDGKSEEEKDQKEKDLNAPDGTLRIHIEWLLREFYLGEMRHDGAHLEDLVGYSKPGYVWSGMLW